MQKHRYRIGIGIGWQQKIGVSVSVENGVLGLTLNITIAFIAQWVTIQDHLWMSTTYSKYLKKCWLQQVHNESSRCNVQCWPVWYGMVNVDLYSAIITKVSNALNMLVSVSVHFNAVHSACIAYSRFSQGSYASSASLTTFTALFLQFSWVNCCF